MWFKKELQPTSGWTIFKRLFLWLDPVLHWCMRFCREARLLDCVCVHGGEPKDTPRDGGRENMFLTALVRQWLLCFSEEAYSTRNPFLDKMKQRILLQLRQNWSGFTFPSNLLASVLCVCCWLNICDFRWELATHLWAELKAHPSRSLRLLSFECLPLPQHWGLEPTVMSYATVVPWIRGIQEAEWLQVKTLFADGGANRQWNRVFRERERERPWNRWIASLPFHDMHYARLRHLHMALCDGGSKSWNCRLIFA